MAFKLAFTTLLASVVPLNPVLAGKPVQLVSVPLAAVPNAGVVRAAPVMVTVPPDAGSMVLAFTVLMVLPQRKTRVAPDSTVRVTPDPTVTGPTMEAL